MALGWAGGISHETSPLGWGFWACALHLALVGHREHAAPFPARACRLVSAGVEPGSQRWCYCRGTLAPLLLQLFWYPRRSVPGRKPFPPFVPQLPSDGN